MKNKIKKHFGYYFSLIAIFVSGLFLVFATGPNVLLQLSMVMITGIFYMILGASHHFVNHELTAKIMVEYILIGALGISIVFFIIVGGLI